MTADPNRDPGDPEAERDPAVSSIPLDTEDGGQVVIEQQNAGPGQQVGAGEFKEDGGADRKSPDTAAEEQRRLEEEAPTD